MPPPTNLTTAPGSAREKPLLDDGVDDDAAYRALELASGASLREIEDHARLLLGAFDPEGVPAALRAATAERAREISRAKEQLVSYWHARGTASATRAAAPPEASAGGEPSPALRAAIARHRPANPAAHHLAKPPRARLTTVGSILLKAALVGLVVAAAIRLQQYRAGHPFFNPFAEPGAAVAVGMPIAPAARWTGFEATDRQATSPLPSRQRRN